MKLVSDLIHDSLLTASNWKSEYYLIGFGDWEMQGLHYFPLGLNRDIANKFFSL